MCLLYGITRRLYWKDCTCTGIGAIAAVQHLWIYLDVFRCLGQNSLGMFNWRLILHKKLKLLATVLPWVVPRKLQQREGLLIYRYSKYLHSYLYSRFVQHPAHFTLNSSLIIIIGSRNTLRPIFFFSDKAVGVHVVAETFVVVVAETFVEVVAATFILDVVIVVWN